jgi:hypothetical protein
VTGRGFKTKRLDWQDDLLAEIPLPRGVLRATRGLGSGLARSRSDPPGTSWAVGDRGPNLKVKMAIRRYGLEQLRPLAGLDGAKLMPCVELGPAIAQLRIVGDAVILDAAMPLRGADGRSLTGLPPPASPHAEHEPIFSLHGEALGTDASGADTEGIAALADGSFWIGDEYGPSLIKLDRKGRVVLRWVPAGAEAFFEGAAYPVAAVLPAIASARRLNRGFEALALSPDERWLFLVFQSPLAKTLVLDSDEAPEICGDLEGAVLLSPRELLLVNDNDFGVEGVGTEFWRVTFDRDVG